MMLELTSIDTLRSVLLYYNAPPLKQTTLERSTSLSCSGIRPHEEVAERVCFRAGMGGTKRFGGLLFTERCTQL